MAGYSASGSTASTVSEGGSSIGGTVAASGTDTATQTVLRKGRLKSLRVRADTADVLKITPTVVRTSQDITENILTFAGENSYFLAQTTYDIWALGVVLLPYDVLTFKVENTDGANAHTYHISYEIEWEEA